MHHHVPIVQFQQFLPYGQFLFHQQTTRFSLVEFWSNSQASYNFIICKYFIMYLVKIFLKSPRQLSHLKNLTAGEDNFYVDKT